MNILIVTLPNDIHSLTVAKVLSGWGHQVMCMSWSDFPQLLSLSYVLKDGRDQLLLRHAGLNLEWATLDVVWNHRFLDAVPPAEIAAPDRKPIELSAKILHQGLLQVMAQHAFLVNSFTAKQLFDNKLFQLRTLADCGFTVPATLISNDRSEISAFIRQQHGCVVKPLKFMKWDCGEYNATLYTTVIDDISQFHALAISACPMIYQEKIHKLHELRVVVFGRQITTFRIDSQQAAASAVDWRVPSYTELRVVVTETPDDIRRQIDRFMSHTGFCYGSFDFAVTPEGRYVCFEFNETGQFLWLEQLCPEAPLLDMFCRFLQSRDPQFLYQQPDDAVRYAAVHQQVVASKIPWQQQHVEVSFDKRFKEHLA